MHPDAGQRRAVMGALALGNLILVMRKLQVDAAAVDVDGLAQLCPDHRRAFDVPAGAAPAPRGVPARLIVGAGFPQHEIGGGALVRRDLDTGTGNHLVHRAARQFPVIGPARHVEQHMPFCGIGVAAFDQPRDHVDHLRHMLRRQRLDVRIDDPERPHVVAVMIGKAVGDDVNRHAFRRCRGDDLVLDIGDVAGVDHVIRPVFVTQQPGEHIEHHRGPRIADMRPVIDRWAADIHRHPVRVGRTEHLLAAGHGVVEADIHWRLIAREALQSKRPAC